jgi:hypothetical protein
MEKTSLFKGFAFGILLALLGAYLFIIFITQYDFWEGYQLMKKQGNIGKLITLGAVPNLILFFILLKLQKEMMARGVVLASIIIAILSIIL